MFSGSISKIQIMASGIIRLNLFIMGFIEFFFIFFSGVKVESNNLWQLTPLCLGCICEATTNCNLTIGCHGPLCGPFFISKIYWEEAGSPVVDNSLPWKRNSYETCVNDPFCAAQTVKKYISRFAQDCNGNGVLECDDFARIHFLGGRQCHLPIHYYNYYKIFRSCDVAVQLLN